jgi:DNA-binding NarL/FixJ family response regulator
VSKPGRLKWENGRLILEIDTTIRVAVEIDAIEKGFKDGINLTKREQQTLFGILKGWSNKEVANDMDISERTVKFHASSLLAKFKVSTRGDLMALFGRQRSGDYRA